ncbi:Ribosomal protein S18 acetylase RimI [Streptoalloteichus tenebrarius]|uniref:Ribosomal protein S18 acetylase RimI n=1 Tax=Streptoalloteichus tenebrarius (strain ATCC 17920 / DSM 40477 / JCM 4838 / CBS 697.72 / NBRC 16177 / NCIMB 11028 / NRRL B-12390 / A12253. 1 / ISP 5477) TaxID=1933 RepID=A0ABT1HTU6_STRSD|nr:GNAT family N-acetyltransferase [Streptoalloteichus tenebrarius]MCP2258934.1 Ribosomal protein S18 acetylase RimI [Streptoalloteichus tenebrarius]BFF01141.1 GNAT family N-acetyltransferase [Streptoalloteichus tenebrarius]
MSGAGAREVLPTPPFRLRPAEPTDADALTAVFLRARAEAMPYLARPHTDAETAAWMSGCVVPTHEVRVAEVDGAVVGFAAVLGEELAHLYVDPTAQGRGVGTALLNWAKRGRARLELFVFQRNERARDFYHGHGFRLLALDDGSRNEEREPDARYSWAAR